MSTIQQKLDESLVCQLSQDFVFIHLSGGSGPPIDRGMLQLVWPF
jgi:hypothetical protein